MLLITAVDLLSQRGHCAVPVPAANHWKLPAVLAVGKDHLNQYKEAITKGNLPPENPRVNLAARGRWPARGIAVADFNIREAS